MVASQPLSFQRSSFWATFAIWLQAHYLFVCRVDTKGLCRAAAPPRSLVDSACSRRAVGRRSHRLLELFLHLVLPARLRRWRRLNNTALESDTRLKLSSFVTLSCIHSRGAGSRTAYFDFYVCGLRNKMRARSRRRFGHTEVQAMRWCHAGN